jgi:hypothetical protein
MPDRRPRPDRQTPARDKICKACGRYFFRTEDRTQDWDIARYCSPQCSGIHAGERIPELKSAILSLLQERDPGKSICPSEAAKLVGGTATRRDWETLMEPARDAARQLSKAGRILITQKGKPVDPEKTKGPIRLHLV